MRLMPKNNGMGWAAYALLGYLGFFLIDPIMNHAGLVTWAWTGLGLLLFLIMYFSLYWVCGWKTVALALGVVLLGVAYLPFNSGASLLLYLRRVVPCLPGEGEHRLQLHRRGCGGLAARAIPAALVRLSLGLSMSGCW